MTSRVKGFDEYFGNTRFSVDDTLLYTGLVRSVLEQCEVVVDVGCGRGQYSDGGTEVPNIFDLRGPGRRVVGIDVDPAGLENPFVDEFELITDAAHWPTLDNSADLVVSDWTLEHVSQPGLFVAELARTLRPRGLFVARSINRYSMLSAVSRLVPNKNHAKVLEKAQPNRLSVDVFPAFYRMNTRKQITSLFASEFDYSIASRPGLENYLRAKHPGAAKAVATMERLLPEPMQTAFVVCARLR